MTNLHEKFIEETGQMPHYLKWVQEKLEKLLKDNPEVGVEDDREVRIMASTRKYIDDSVNSVFDSRFMGDYETTIVYDDEDLSYTTQIIFPRVLTLSEKEEVEHIIGYWSNIPYVSVEGNYGIEWMKVRNRNNSAVLISIDFTKSASDDYMSREILEKLAEWVWQGTPKRKHGDRKYEGVVKPLVVRADNV